MEFVGEDENFPPTETELNIFFVVLLLLVLLLLVLLLLVLFLLVLLLLVLLLLVLLLLVLLEVMVLFIRRGAFCADMDVAWDVLTPP